MHLAADYIHPHKDAASSVRARCRIRLYLPAEHTDAAVVICSELVEDPVVGDVARIIAAEVISHFRLPGPPIWVEHHPPEVTNGTHETFELIIFADYVVRNAVRAGVLVKEIGEPTRKRLDRQTVEMLVGQRV